MQQLKQEVLDCLTNNILPYWLRLQDNTHGGFYGQVTGTEQLIPDAPRGAILYARILWAFSAAYRVLRQPEYLQAATRAKDYILQHFIDPVYGGTYWSIDYLGRPIDTKKQFYALGFMIYGFSEYARATGDDKSLQTAIDLFRCIEQHSRDNNYNGYIEATTCDWKPIADMRLSDKDQNMVKSQNTHLHILEPYTNLYRIWHEPALKDTISNLIRVFDNLIRDPKTNHMNLFFDEQWNTSGQGISYGHDIEASWLIDEAAQVIGEKHDELVLRIAKAAEEGLNSNGSMRHEDHDPDIHWWVMAETVVGYANIYQHFGDTHAKDHAYKAWQYIKDHLIDYTHGEWYWSCYPDGTHNTTDDKAGFWKCPYHNSRMCLEIIQRF